MESSPWGHVELEEEGPYSRGYSFGPDGQHLCWRYNMSVLERCPGWGKFHPCANRVMIQQGKKICRVCTLKRDAACEDEKAAVEAVSAVWKKFGGVDEPPPESTLADEAEPQDDNVMFQEGGETFTATEAVDAAMEVARVLAANGEHGFDVLFTPEDEEVHGSRGLSDDILKAAICRLAYIADTEVLPWKTTKAASVLGGVRPWPPIIPGKAGRSKIGHVSNYAESAFVYRLLLERGPHKSIKSGKAFYQVRAFMSEVYDDTEVATVCYAALAAACVAHIKEKNLCSLERGCLTWHHFAGGCWATGNFPTWQ